MSSRAPSKRDRSPYSRRDREELWAAMLALAPVIIGGDLQHAPAGAAHLVRDHAEALLEEWRGTVWPLQHQRTRRQASATETPAS